MKFTLSLDNANELYRFAKAYIDPKCSITKFTTIACQIEGKTLTATMLDGTIACQLKLVVDSDTDGECFIAPPVKAFKRSDAFVTVEDSEKETIYKTAMGSSSYHKPDLSDPSVFDLDKIMNEPIESLWINPKKLAAALNAFDDTVKIDFTGKRSGVILSNLHTKAIAMPVNPPKGEAE